MSIQKHIPSLYIHIPFCISKCIYCDFNSIIVQSQVVDEYLDAIRSELQAIKGEYYFTTVYIGGGTPTVLNEIQLSKLLNIISKHVDISNIREYTIEANPGTLNDEKILALKNSQVNRISVGVQSFNDKYLTLLGRIHSAKEAKDIEAMKKKSGWLIDLADLELIKETKNTKRIHK